MAPSPDPPRRRHTLSMITIGQSPRHDYDADLPALLPPNTTLQQLGALDGLSRAEIERDLGPAPGSGAKVLVSRMRDGSQVEMDAEKLEPLVEACVRGGVGPEGDVDAVLLLCTGVVPSYAADLPVPLVCPQPAVRDYLLERGRTRPGTRLVVVSPEARQVDAAHERWDGVGGCAVVGAAAATPYGEESARELDGVARWVGELRTDLEGRAAGGMGVLLVYLDCMGFTMTQKRVLEEETAVEVVVPREVVFKAVGRLFEEC